MLEVQCSPTASLRLVSACGRRQIQLQSTASLGALSMAQKIMQREGIAGFYRGFLPNALKNLPNKGGLPTSLQCLFERCLKVIMGACLVPDLAVPPSLFLGPLSFMWLAKPDVGMCRCEAGSL